MWRNFDVNRAKWNYKACLEGILELKRSGFFVSNVLRLNYSSMYVPKQYAWLWILSYGSVPGDSWLIIIKMLSIRIWMACIFWSAVRKAARARRIESTWFVSRTPAVRQSPATNKGVLLGEASLHPFSLARKKANWKAPNLAGLHWDL